MSSINDFLKYLNNLKDDDSSFYKIDWYKNLNKIFEEWEALIKDSSNWEKIEKAIPEKRHYDELCELFIEKAGLGLAIRWFNSSIEDQREEAIRYLKNNIERYWDSYTDRIKDYLINNEISYVIDYLNKSIWLNLSDEQKIKIISYVFENFPGEPWEHLRRYNQNIIDELHWLLRDIYDEWRYSRYKKNRLLYLLSKLKLPFYIHSYLPSKEIILLKSIIEGTNDKKYIEIMNNLINLLKQTSDSILFSIREKYSYSPTLLERKLIAKVFEITKESGYLLMALPEIQLTEEIPPLFIAFPDLDDIENDDENSYEPEKKEDLEEAFNKHKKTLIPDKFTIEELLGCYLPDTATIKLYNRGILWACLEYNLEYDLLKAVVLIHEIAHWLMHKITKNNFADWDLNLYKKTSEEVHETWAQLITYKCISSFSGQTRHRLEKTFLNLNKRQTSIYQLYQNFISYDSRTIIDSLEKIRALNKTISLSEWEEILKD